MLAGLDDGQRAAVLAPSGPVCVLAGAGTGKTRTITHRIAHLVGSGAHPSSEVLAVTFTTRAAGEMRVRLRSLGVPGCRPGPSIRPRSSSCATSGRGRSAARCGRCSSTSCGWSPIAARRANAGTDAATLRDLASEIEWSKATLAGPQDYLAAVAKHRRDTPLPAETVAKVFEVYESVKNEAEQLDFDDLLLHTCAVLEDDEAVAREFRSRYRCFVVDEYQDVTPLQQRTLDAWLGGRDQLTVVGDANQTIYSFAGASPCYLLGLRPEVPATPKWCGWNGTTGRRRRWSSLANRVIAGSTGAAARYRLRLTAALPDGPAATFTEHPDEPTEASSVAAAAAALIEGGMPASGIAVLYRINAQSEVYEGALTAQGVPYVVRGGERFFARPEVRQALGLLRTSAQRLAHDGADRDSGPTSPDGRLVPTVRVLLGDDRAERRASPPGALRDRWDSLVGHRHRRRGAGRCRPGRHPGRVGRGTRPAGGGSARPDGGGRHARLAACRQGTGVGCRVPGGADRRDVADPARRNTRGDRGGTPAVVRRASPGHGPGWHCPGRCPGRKAAGGPGDAAGSSPASPPIRRRHGTGAPHPAGAGYCGGRLLSPAQVKMGRCANCPSSADPELVDALRTWRKTRSTEASVPAFVVFSDATLLAIAERRPTDNAALLAIPGIGRGQAGRVRAGRHQDRHRHPLIDSDRFF